VNSIVHRHLNAFIKGKGKFARGTYYLTKKILHNLLNKVFEKFIQGSLLHHSPVSMVLPDGGRSLLSKWRLSVFSWRVFEEEDVTLETPAFVGQEEDILRRQSVHVDQESVEVRLETKRSKQGLL
jgi:hypothetical protein